MKKIEHLPRVGKKNLYGKIDEIVDVVNDLCHFIGAIDKTPEPKETAQYFSLNPKTGMLYKEEPR